MVLHPCIIEILGFQDTIESYRFANQDIAFLQFLTRHESFTECEQKYFLDELSVMISVMMYSPTNASIDRFKAEFNRAAAYDIRKLMIRFEN